MKHLFTKTITLFAVTLATPFILATDAPAFTITQNNDSQALLDALLGDTSGLSNFEVSTTGYADGFGLFSDDPFSLNSGVVLSTGKATDLVGVNQQDDYKWPNYETDLNTQFDSSWSGTGEYDVATLELRFDADDTADKLFFEYVFGSEEFVEYGGSAYNDSFELLLNGKNLALLDDGQEVTINNLVPDEFGPYHSNYIDNPVGSSVNTKLDGYTTVLGFEGLLNQNASNTLSIRVKDISDARLDSAVFVKGNSLGSKNPKDVPEPTAVLGLLVLGGLGMNQLRSKSQ
ncbi:choice-of-anchor L domain-containing protein [Spirulina sp. CS-785/01]|uniref:choice-of-anchor L domain-containing protein n=1 Tax=Spirulina sp. CS-785/01 TaxID=3021716 RepID=UPI00232DF25C|nr:choice-of-anchor L domain-containing protein [Spirulina sp. CS-785/01]MDB9314735.1 choice-of-anchor L domain-containing protein [Spirulina sp. CS-785/01]